MSSSLRDTLTRLIKKSRLADLIWLVEKFEDELPEEVNEEFVVLSGAFHKLQEEKQKGTISSENAKLEHRRLLDSLQSVLSEVPSGLVLDKDLAKALKKRQQRNYLFAVIPFVAIAICLLVLLQPMNQLPVNMQVEAQRFSFSMEESRKLFPGTFFKRFELHYYEQISYDCNTITTAGERIESNSLTLSPLEGFEGDPLIHGSCTLQELDIPASTDLALKIQEGGIWCDMNGKSALGGSISYADSLLIQTNFSQSDLEAYPEFYNATDLILGCKDLACSATFSCPAEGGTLYMLPAQATAFSALKLKGKQFSFADVSEGREVSTVKKGKLLIQSEGKEPFREILLEKDDAFLLSSESKAEITRLEFTPELMRINLTGSFDKLAWGTGENLQRFAPYRVEWLWYQHRVVLITGIVLLALMLFVLNMLMKRFL